MTDGVRILRLIDMPDADATRIGASIDAIFFASSNTQTFASDAARAAFRERWLGRYLTHDLPWFYVALAAEGSVAGYLAGSLEDPARTARFADIPYFQDFAAATQRFPAHLHVNLASHQRGNGVGSELVARFCRDAAMVGTRGVHVVTSAGARNIGFYARNGFHEQARHGQGPREVVFLGRIL